MTRTFFLPTAALLALLTLAGCTSYVSRGIDSDGKAAELVWPGADQQQTWQTEGSFPNRENLRAIGPGATKDQLYALIGRPHFDEGMAAVREWDYVFHFRSGGGATSCRYKVIFDTAYKARSFHWNPAICAELAKG